MVASRSLHKANSVRWLRLSFNGWAKQHGSDFREQRRRLAIPKLARIIRDAGRSHAERQHAIETFGLVINQRFHHAQDPMSVTDAWLVAEGSQCLPGRLTSKTLSS